MKPVALSDHHRGISFALTGFTLWVLCDTFMKLAGESTLPAYEIVAFLGLFGTLFMLAKSAWQKTPPRQLWPRKPQLQLGPAILSLLINLCNAVALKHIALTWFYVTVFTAPIVVSILGTLVLNERLTRIAIGAIVAGFAGVLIAVNPFAQSPHGDLIGYGATLASVACYSASVVWLRVMSRTESVDSIAFFFSLFQGVVGFLLMLFHAEPVGVKILMWLFGMGFFCVAGNLCSFLALKYTTAATVAQYHYTQIVVGALVGYLIWNEMPTWNLLIGTLIILGAGIAIAMQKPALVMSQALPDTTDV